MKLLCSGEWKQVKLSNWALATKIKTGSTWKELQNFLQIHITDLWSHIECLTHVIFNNPCGRKTCQDPSQKTKASDSIVKEILDYRVIFHMLTTILECLSQMLLRISLITYFMFNAISLLFSGAMKIHIILSVFQHKLFQSFNAFELIDEKEKS
jgi:hypothetical protein